MHSQTSLDIVVQIGSRLANAFTGFSRTEKAWCKLKSSWQWLSGILMSESPEELTLRTCLSPAQDFTMAFQFAVVCLLDLSQSGIPKKISHVCKAIDDDTNIDYIVKNTKLLRLLLALHSAGKRRNKMACFCIFQNANIFLAHIVQKFPDVLKMNFFKTNSKSRKLRYSLDDMHFWLKAEKESNSLIT